MPNPYWMMPGLADAGRRLAARLIDYVILLGVGALVIIGYVRAFFPPEGSDAEASPAAVAGLAAFAPLWLWGLEAVQLASWGRTLGMALLRIRVAPADRPQEPLSGGRALARALCFPLLFTALGWFSLGVVSLLNDLWLLWDRPLRQCLHDKMAGTVVMDDAESPRGPMFRTVGGALALLCALGVAGIIAGG